jgi:hypothetical protein
MQAAGEATEAPCTEDEFRAHPAGKPEEKLDDHQSPVKIICYNEPAATF